MSNKVVYELVCYGLAVSAEGVDQLSRTKVDPERLALAHRMAGVLLGQRPPVEGHCRYAGCNGEMLLLPGNADEAITVKLALDDIDPRTVAAMAEIAAALQCTFVPWGGGACIAAEADALMADVAGRAVRHVVPQGSTLYENTRMDVRIGLA
ncbi:hypothetical protein GT347_11225 [Xylophilus rhododendri]|uniref:Uncharacterized protein n=1 Tax=Xylophilus rhododendri TaxID=2697032 RepID=A0A857J409_9BURK|nr:hypothetical protein [Xylophilus rhododendri]QHI98516.1 hypothetical protein GT347_11225 [Xylophilus rhododendri]